MNYGPLEFAAHLRRKGASRKESAADLAARAAAPVPPPEQNLLTIAPETAPSRPEPAASGAPEAKVLEV